jgi:phospholipid/cholesterol/gamma-HCH transport system ATP-binding protein
LIRIEALEKSWDRRVLSGVELEIGAGSLLGLIGPPAGGKTTLLKAIAGLLRPDRGRIFVEETEITSLGELDLANYRAGLGMQFQNNALFDHMTVAENIAFPLRRSSALSEVEIIERVEERLKAVALPGFGERMPASLSGGQRRRVGIARATSLSPPIILYDEPAAGLDPVSSQKIFQLLRKEQQAQRTTVVMVSSDLDRLLPIVDRVAVLVGGSIAFTGSAEEARASADDRVRLFVAGDPACPL